MEAVGRGGGLAETSLILLALGMEGRATGRGRPAASGSCERSGGRFSPDPRRHADCPPCFSTGRPSCDFLPTELRGYVCAVQAASRYSSKRDPVQQVGEACPAQGWGAGAFPPRPGALRTPPWGARQDGPLSCPASHAAPRTASALPGTLPSCGGLRRLRSAVDSPWGAEPRGGLWVNEGRGVHGMQLNFFCPGRQRRPGPGWSDVCGPEVMPYLPLLGSFL